MMSPLKWIALIVIVAAAICVPIVLVVHHALMPEATQLSQIDAAAQAAAPPGSALRRLRAPDRIESEGRVKFGYFTYEVTAKTSTERYRADWRITDGNVELISFKRL